MLTLILSFIDHYELYNSFQVAFYYLMGYQNNKAGVKLFANCYRHCNLQMDKLLLAFRFSNIIFIHVCKWVIHFYLVTYQCPVRIESTFSYT